MRCLTKIISLSNKNQVDYKLAYRVTPRFTDQPTGNQAMGPFFHEKYSATMMFTCEVHRPTHRRPSNGLFFHFLWPRKEKREKNERGEREREKGEAEEGNVEENKKGEKSKKWKGKKSRAPSVAHLKPVSC